MKFTASLLTAVAVGAVVAPMTSASAAAKHHPRHSAPARHVVHHADAGDSALREQVAQLQAEVASLHQEMEGQKQAQASTQAQVAETSSQVSQVQQQVAATPAVTKAEVQNQIASAVEKEQHQDHFGYKGIHITPGGFLEAAGIYRQHFQGNDIASSFSVPFANQRTYGVSESRFTARQSRVSFLAQGMPKKDVTLSMYGEFDFLGGAQTANSNESNSYNPRIRHMYGTIDWNKGDTGIHILAGQTWSLVTLNSKGITPRNEVTPLVPEAQYVPGFTWTRQPQFRITTDFMNHHLWLAASVENAETTFGGSYTPANLTYYVTPGAGFDSTAFGGKLPLNGTPDFVGKVAYEGAVSGHNLHLEAFALDSTFTAHYNGGTNENKAGYGFGGGVIAQVVPNLLDVQFSGMYGRGIGRYGSAQLPDVFFTTDGHIHPAKELMMLGGVILHANKMLDVYTYAGEEQEFSFNQFGSTGLGLVTANDSGCFVEGGTCGGDTRRIRQITAGFWQKIYNGNFGRAQVGVQWSYTQRELFYASDVGGMPQVGQNMGFLSFRYYPF